MAKGNTNSGAGGSNKSTIIVTAPTGSTVYIQSQDGKRKDAGEKNGVWTFKGCDIGTWMVHASQGDQSETVAVEITEEGQLMRYYVSISYFTATIQVTYPAGSVCTCSKGATVLTAPDQSGSVTFTVPEDGDWVVSCTKDTNIASETVQITEKGQIKTIALYYEYRLYYNGKEHDITGGWDVQITCSGNITKNNSNIDIDIVGKGGGEYVGYIYTKNPIDFTNYKTLKINSDWVTSRSSAGSYVFFGVSKTLPTIRSEIDMVASVDHKGNEVDVSSVNGEYYVIVGSAFSGMDAYYAHLNVEEIILE